jgi:hypothetical protein
MAPCTAPPTAAVNDWENPALPARNRLPARAHFIPYADVSTAVRFHPLEILLSMGIKIAAVLLLGAPASAVLVFELLLNAQPVDTRSK